MQTTIKLPGSALAQALRNVALFASADKTLPVLTGVVIDYGPDGVAIVATDRYVMAREELPADATEVTGEAGVIFLDMPTVKQLYSLKGSAYDAPTMITVDDDGVTITCPDGTTLVKTPDASDGSRFPRWRTVWDRFMADVAGQEDPSARAPGAQKFTSAYIAKFARIKGGDGYMTMTGAPDRQHSVVTCGPVTACLMQVKIAA